MFRSPRTIRRILPLLVVPLVCTGFAFGCARPRKIEPLTIAHSLGVATIAIAPAINESGSMDFDPNRFAGVMAGELGFAERVSVIPVNRVRGALAVQGKDRIESPGQALEVAGLVGADAIVVFAVTEYDVSGPPRIGIAAQLYGSPPRSGPGEQAASADGGVGPTQGRLLARTHGVFSARQAGVLEDLRSYAARRDGDQSPDAWQRYVMSRQLFMQYCCHATIRALLNGDVSAVAARGMEEGR